MSKFYYTTRRKSIQSCRLNVHDLQKLREVILRINDDCIEKIIAHREKASNGPLTKDMIEKIKLEILPKIMVQGDNGHTVSSFEPKTLEAKDLPRNIEQIRCDNNSYYAFSNSNNNPENFFEILIDFQRVKIIDLSNAASEDVYGHILTSGTSQTWVDGSFAAIDNVFSAASSIHSKLHKRYSFEISFWLICVPIYSMLLTLHYQKLHDKLMNIPLALEALLLLVVFLFFSLVCRVAFNVLKFTYPYHELAFAEERLSLPRLALNFTFVSLLGGAILGIGTLLWQIFIGS